MLINEITQGFVSLGTSLKMTGELGQLETTSCYLKDENHIKDENYIFHLL